MVGPFALKLTGNAEDVMHSTEFGVVMLLFIIGLELEPRKFWAMRKSILGLGFSDGIYLRIDIPDIAFGRVGGYH